MPITMPADVRAGVERTHADFMATADTVARQCNELGKCSHAVVAQWQNLADRWEAWYTREWDDGYGLWGGDLTTAERFGTELLAVRRALTGQGFNFYGVITRTEDPLETHSGAQDQRTKRYLGYAAAAAGVTVAVFGIWQIVKIRAVSNIALNGLPSGAFSGARFPVKSSARPKPRGARSTSLTGRRRPLRGKKKGRGLRGRDYNMEVMP